VALRPRTGSAQPLDGKLESRLRLLIDAVEPGGGDAATLRHATAAPTAPLTLPMITDPSLIDERYEIESRLGIGGMGACIAPGPYVALKDILDSVRDDPKASIALQREARRAQTLNHPNIVRVFYFDPTRLEQERQAEQAARLRAVEQQSRAETSARLKAIDQINAAPINAQQQAIATPAQSSDGDAAPARSARKQKQRDCAFSKDRC
jgi:hypothetical protein